METTPVVGANVGDRREQRTVPDPYQCSLNRVVLATAISLLFCFRAKCIEVFPAESKPSCALAARTKIVLAWTLVVSAGPKQFDCLKNHNAVAE